MSDGPLFAYRALLKEGVFKPDPVQHLAIEKLQSLHLALAGYQPAQGRHGWLGRFGFRGFHHDDKPDHNHARTAEPAGGDPHPVERRRRRREWGSGDAVGGERRQGLYLYGQVGRGKSMLMDLFFDSATIAGKKRLHFHQFMRDVHAEIHAWRAAPHRRDADPIPNLARSIAAEAWLLCLDELEIDDIADAMIVGRLFECLLDDGVVLVITSNRPPGELYRDGLQRDRFLPFIHLMEARLDLLHLDGRFDHRRGRRRGIEVYHTPLGPDADRALDAAFSRLAGGAPGAPETISVQGRTLSVPLAAAGVARFSFASLCGAALGAADYLALAERYHALVLSDVPVMAPDDADRARRFVMLIDALYDHRGALVCSAAAPPDALYPAGLVAGAFARTASRLIEMQSEAYLDGLAW